MENIGKYLTFKISNEVRRLWLLYYDAFHKRLLLINLVPLQVLPHPYFVRQGLLCLARSAKTHPLLYPAQNLASVPLIKYAVIFFFISILTARVYSSTVVQLYKWKKAEKKVKGHWDYYPATFPTTCGWYSTYYSLTTGSSRHFNPENLLRPSTKP